MYLLVMSSSYQVSLPPQREMSESTVVFVLCCAALQVSQAAAFSQAAAADPTCATGILDANKQNCCAKFCGKCGGTSCQTHGGAANCCSGSISRSGNSCESSAPPCAMGPPVPTPPAMNLTAFTCAMRHLALRAASAKLVPTPSGAGGASALRDVADALRLHECGDNSSPSPAPLARQPGGFTAVPADAIFVAPEGDDATGDGSALRPFATPHRARDMLRAGAPHGDKIVVLRGGTYHLGDSGGTLQLDASDSGTTWMAYPADLVPGGRGPPLLSGTRALGTLQFEPWAGHDAIVVANLSDAVAAGARFQALFFSMAPDADGSHSKDARGARRLIRARVPDADPLAVSGLCFMGGEATGEACNGYFKGAGHSGDGFKGNVSRSVNFAVPKGGLVANDSIYSNYSVSFQQPPGNYLLPYSDPSEGTAAPQQRAGAPKKVAAQKVSGGDWDSW